MEEELHLGVGHQVEEEHQMEEEVPRRVKKVHPVRLDRQDNLGEALHLVEGY